MNEEQKQKLSTYLDGALPAEEAAAFELEIAKSPELLAGLEELRAVSKMLKELPREPLPAGFLQRLQRRREAAGAPEPRDWVFLAPAYRPVAAALSGLIVAIVVWDKVDDKPLPPPPYDHVAVKSAAEAPPTQYDLSRNLSARGLKAPAQGPSQGAQTGETRFAAPLEAEFQPPAVELPDGERQEALVAKRERARAKGGPLGAGETSEVAAETAAPASPGVAALRGGASPAAPRMLSEEERSARNEEMYEAFEREKKLMGIRAFAGRDDGDAARRVLQARAEVEAARIDSMTPNLLSAGSGVLPRALRSQQAYREAWAALKLASDPPPVDFAKTMVIVLPEPGAIISLGETKTELVVVWRRVPGGSPADRLRAVPVSGKPPRLLRRD